MAIETEGFEPTWRKCDNCDYAYFIGAVLSPRTRRWSPIPLSLVPKDVPGNFSIRWEDDFVEVWDARDVFLGAVPIVVYGSGVYRPHNPSHFLEHHHGEEEPKQRLHNFQLPMDEDEGSRLNPRMAR